MVIPGVTIRKPSVNVRELGRRALLTVCHAISMAITVVLPAPVASFIARRKSAGLAASLCLPAASASSWNALFGRDLGQPYNGLCRLDLTEEQGSVARLLAPV